MAMLGDAGDGATPLRYEESEELIPTWPSSRGEVNLLEAQAIEEAWSRLDRTVGAADILERQWLIDLHREMFRPVWRWAGRFRTSNTNLGVDRPQIPAMFTAAVDDARMWLGTWSDDVLVAVAFHHRLVAVHPFSNGNGRHARLVADALVRATGHPQLKWGTSHESQDERRRTYIAALREADRCLDYEPLLAFARS